MDFLDVSLAFPVRWHDIIDILEMNNPQILREAGRGRRGLTLSRTGNAFQTPPTPHNPSLHWTLTSSTVLPQETEGTLWIQRQSTYIYTHTHIRLNWYKDNSLGKCLTNAIKNQFADKRTPKQNKNTFYTTLNGRQKSSTGSGAGRTAAAAAAGKSQWIAIKLQLQQSSGLSFMQLKGKCCVHTAMVQKISIVPAVWWV